MIVAVCDDNREFLESIGTALRSYSQVDDVQLFANRKDFIENYCDDFDIILMDMDWNEEFGGLKVTEHIHAKNAKASVILLAEVRDAARLQHIYLETNAVDGILFKPVDTDILGQYLSKLSSGMKEDQKKRLLIKEQGRTISIMFKDIHYLESQNHMIEIHTPQKVYCVYEPLKLLIQRLPDNFCRCHKSFVANMDYIKEFSVSKVVMMDGYEFSVGRTFKDALDKKYANFAKYIQLEEVR